MEPLIDVRFTIRETRQLMKVLKSFDDDKARDLLAQLHILKRRYTFIERELDQIVDFVFSNKVSNSICLDKAVTKICIALSRFKASIVKW